MLVCYYVAHHIDQYSWYIECYFTLSRHLGVDRFFPIPLNGTLEKAVETETLNTLRISCELARLLESKVRVSGHQIDDKQGSQVSQSSFFMFGGLDLSSVKVSFQT